MGGKLPGIVGDAIRRRLETAEITFALVSPQLLHWVCGMVLAELQHAQVCGELGDPLWPHLLPRPQLPAVETRVDRQSVMRVFVDGELIWIS